MEVYVLLVTTSPKASPYPAGSYPTEEAAYEAARLLYAVRYDDPAPWGINEQMVHPGGRAGEYNFAAILKFEMGHTHFSAVNAMRAIYHLEREMGEDNERR